MFRKSSLFAIGFLAIGFLSIALATSTTAGQRGRGAESSINPQPLPPRVSSRVLQQQAGLAIAGSGIGPGAHVMINPQPLPPKPQHGAFAIW